MIPHTGTNSPVRYILPNLPLYLAEGLTSLAATWFCSGIYFVTRSAFNWTAQQNLVLATFQGIVYVVGALLAARCSKRLGRRRLLVVVYGMLAVLTLAMTASSSPVPFVALLMCWMFLCAINWPAMEALLCHGSSAADVSKRVAVYNVVWALAGAVAIAAMGFLSPRWIFLSAGAIHALSAALVWGSKPPEEDPAPVHFEAPPELRGRRELAKRLSRLALPASYTIIYALTPLLVTLPAVRDLPRQTQGLLVSVWLVARVATFTAMGATAIWHGRPGLLLVAVVTMTLAFVGAVTPVEPYPLVWVVGTQLVLGTAMGFIYAGSLYFGMVLAHGGEGEGGSTEQGGYHEALVGLGTILGPGVGAVAGGAGGSQAVGVGAVVVISAAACGVSAWRARAKPQGR